MKLLSYTLCFCLALGLALADDALANDQKAPSDPSKGHHGGSHGSGGGGGHGSHSGSWRAGDVPNRCNEMEMDAVTVDEEGLPLFFKAEHIMEGFEGNARLSNETYPELDKSHHLDHVSAAFRMHHEGSPLHLHLFIVQDDELYAYHEHKLEDGYPKKMADVFPGVPSNVTAAVECPKSDCDADSIFFFADNHVHLFDMEAKSVAVKDFEAVSNCTSAFRFLEHFYCFNGHKFSKFDPKTGEVHAKYPKDSHSFFMRCASYGDNSDHTERERCSRDHLDAITSDHVGNVFVFRGHHFIRRAEDNETFSADSIEKAFGETRDNVDAAFSYNDQLHMIKGDQVHTYQDEAPYALNHSSSLKEVLGMDAPVDAAFVCDDDHDDYVHVIKGSQLYDVNMKAAVRAPENERTLTLFKMIDAAKCDKTGVRVFVGNHFYHFNSLTEMALAKALPEQHRVSMELFGCDH